MKPYTLAEQLAERKAMQARGWKWSGTAEHFHKQVDGDRVALVTWCSSSGEWSPSSYCELTFEQWSPEIGFESALVAASYGEVASWRA